MHQNKIFHGPKICETDGAVQSISAINYVTLRGQKLFIKTLRCRASNKEKTFRQSQLQKPAKMELRDLIKLKGRVMFTLVSIFHTLSFSVSAMSIDVIEDRTLNLAPSIRQSRQLHSDGFNHNLDPGNCNL